MQVTFHTDRSKMRGYNIFNMSNISSVDQIATLLQTISNPARLQILLAIGGGEVCVCHLEAMLGLRQATLSQHLMTLREAGLVTDRRASRFIFYQLANPRLLGVLHQVADMQGISLPNLAPSPTCECPNCSKQRDECCK
jgi:DNA-binding transcriptional ArsR family regulator